MMALLSRFRILKRLANLEVQMAAVPESFTKERLQAVQDLAAFSRGLAPCGRCRAMVLAAAVGKPDGPVLVQKVVDDKLIKTVVCYFCEGAARRYGWKPVPTTKADPQVPPDGEHHHEQEASA